MRMPHMNLSPVTMSETYGHYLLVRFQAVPEVGDFLAYFVTVRADVKTDIDAHKDAVLARQAAMAVRDFHNDKMEEEIRIRTIAWDDYPRTFRGELQDFDYQSVRGEDTKVGSFSVPETFSDHVCEQLRVFRAMRKGPRFLATLFLPSARGFSAGGVL